MKAPEDRDDPCEWDPERQQGATREHGCPRPAAVVTTGGGWRLCSECAALPNFARYKRKPVTKPPLKSRRDNWP